MGNDEDFAFKLTKGEAESIATWTTGKEHEVMLPIKNGEGRIIHFFGDKEGKNVLTKKIVGLELTISQNPQYLLITDQQ